MKKITGIIIVLITLFSITSCDDWLDVQPEAEVDLVEQISSPEGISEMLTGVYSTLVSEKLYGRELMYGALEDLAQNNLSQQSTNTDRGLTNYTYDSVEAETLINNVWLTMYNAIANNNVVLKSTEDLKSQLQNDDYSLLKGEALALRAFMHFDLLRMYGERYTDITKTEKQIPYVLTFERVIYPRLPAEDVYNFILEDLDNAEKILKVTDPLAGGSYSGNLFNPNNRKYRFNYYAVLALKARVYLTMGDQTNALKYSEKVINEYNWTFTSVGDLVNNDFGQRDLLYFNEVIAALNVQKLDDYYATWFASSGNIYTTSDNTDHYARFLFEVAIQPEFPWDPMIPGPGINDIRFLYGLKTDGSGNLAQSIKYAQNTEDFDGSFPTVQKFKAVPLFRITEMMLIAAEASISTNRNLAENYILQIQNQREVITEDLTTKTEQELMGIIRKEFRKETFMEGQTFFMYKRLGLAQIPAMGFQSTLDLTMENYIFPLPDNEIEFGN